MFKNVPKFLFLETLFLGVIFYFFLDAYDLTSSGFSVLKGNVNVFWGSGQETAYLSTGVIGYACALLYQQSLGNKSTKWTKVLAMIGLLGFTFNLLKLAVSIPVFVQVEPAFLILIIDWVRRWKALKDPKVS